MKRTAQALMTLIARRGFGPGMPIIDMLEHQVTVNAVVLRIAPELLSLVCYHNNQTPSRHHVELYQAVYEHTKVRASLVETRKAWGILWEILEETAKEKAA
ncbi:MAG: hypothetical protein ACRC8D_07220 [Aeromonas sp.]